MVTPTRSVGHPYHPRPRGHGPHNAEGRFTISGIGSIGDFNGLIGKKGCATLAMLQSN